jgi:23S rRNA pseudouridine1911/1915/1917 synthase
MNEAQFGQVRIDAHWAGSRLDTFLTSYLNQVPPARAKLSRAQIQRLIDEGQITLNGTRTKSSARIKTDDRIEIHLLPPREPTVGAEPLPLTVLYEDSDCIVLDKAAGMTVHPAAGHWSGTLVNALLNHCPDLDGIGGVRRPGIVHRLDKDTSGVLVAAKNAFAYQSLVDQFKERRVEKEYLALARGRVAAQTGRIDRPIGRHRSHRKKMSSVRSVGGGREALTEWTVEERFAVGGEAAPAAFATLLRIRPRTGRTHQIRVHLADLGHPLVGDPVYGPRRRSGIRGDSIIDAFARQALHAERLTFDHPRSGRRMKFVAPLADDFRELLRCLRTPAGCSRTAPGVDKAGAFK